MSNPLVLALTALALLAGCVYTLKRLHNLPVEPAGMWTSRKVLVVVAGVAVGGMALVGAYSLGKAWGRLLALAMILYSAAQLQRNSPRG